MQMKDVIRQKRRERGLTQEQVAERLGVSAPAVNKWESGASYPDITLLSALARLLETDLNELFCFRENLTKEEITGYANEIGEIARKDGVEKALELVRERIREYPSCGELLYQMGVMVRGMSVLFMVPEEELEKNQAFAVELYERAITCGKPATADLARHGLASMYIQEGAYEKAEELISRLPEYQAPDRRQLLISMYMKQKRYEDAAKLLEGKLNGQLQEVFLMLDQLAVAAVREGDRERALEIAEYSRKVMGIYQWDYSACTVAFTVAVEEKDAHRCVELLREMLGALSKPWELGTSLLFTHLDTKESDPKMGHLMTESLFRLIEKEDEYAFLRECEEFQELKEKYMV